MFNIYNQLFSQFQQEMANKNIGRARILQQLKNMQKDKVDYLHAQPLQTDLYTWHFTFRGPQNTDFHEGLYHGQIILPFQYPFKPPDIIFANKNGRFEVNTKICLTITQYHTEQWNSAWTIRTMIQAVVSLFNEKVIGHGYLESSSDARRFFAKASHDYTCEKCGKISQIVKPRQPISKTKQQVIQQENRKIEQPQPVQLTYRTLSQKKQQVLASNTRPNNENLRKVQIHKQQDQIPHKDHHISPIPIPTKQKPQPPPTHTNHILPSPTNKTKQPSSNNKNKKTSKKKISPHNYFYNTLLQGHEEYLAVIKSKKFVQE